ncbi:MAG: hypothetical protein CUN53_01895 [Phototrophicales bacterium]|nr:MAG: hypothetical protein CUN53_01895 [Phototrophicales bacterium]
MQTQINYNISHNNEKKVAEWFEQSGYQAARPNQREGKNADWRIEIEGKVIFCEVKTLFASSQTSLSREQQVRERIRIESVLDKERIKRGYPSVYADRSIRQEASQPSSRTVSGYVLREFREKLVKWLQNDADIKTLPLDVTLVFPASVPADADAEALKANIKAYLRGLDSAVIEDSREFPIGTDKGNLTLYVAKYPDDNNLQVISTISAGEGVTNEEKFKDVIVTAVTQLKSSINREEVSQKLAIIALWKEDGPPMSMWLATTSPNPFSSQLPGRYYAVDWAFSANPILDAVLLFFDHDIEKRKDIWDYLPKPTHVPFAHIICNPSKPNVRAFLERTITTQHKMFWDAIPQDPLAAETDKE